MRIPIPPEQPPQSLVHQEAPPLADPAAPPLPPLPPLPALTARKGGKKHLYFGFGGLVVGIVTGLLLGALGGAVSSSSGIEDSVSACSAEGAVGVTVMDKGRSLDMGTAGEDSKGTTIGTVVCILNELGAPESLFSRIESTRALDGTREASWDGYSASWTYHPDNGLNIIVETAK